MAASTPDSDPSSALQPLTYTQDGLEQLRKRLLDLTRRNKLLSFRHSIKSSLRVVDELPDELFRHLRDEETLTFKPVPEPEFTKNQELQSDTPALPLNLSSPSENASTHPFRSISAKDRAAELGIAATYDLPNPNSGANPRHFDKYIQTLHYPEELEAILRRISSSARTALEESGTNMLYLVFGFLEWYESPHSTAPLLAPLVTLPVELTRSKPSRSLGGMFEYTIEYTGEDLLTNLSLVERMKRDFALSVPLLDDEDTPESYFEKFAELLSIKTRWRIRRQVTLTLLHFGKLLMFLDLDQSRHPGLLSHPRVTELLGATSSCNEYSYGEVYELDEPEIAKELPHVIYDADSSQHSALIDAIQGANMVIEGPPGTGKSQTITNLIAAFLAKGKSVLFVSEKLAALEVVRRRLDHAGLGDFCLELHSHKTKKDKFLFDIQQRIKRQRLFRPADGLPEKIRLLERQKKELVQYAKLINEPFGALRKTIFDIIWRREVLLQDHSFLHGFVDRLILPAVDQLTPSEQEHQCLLVDVYQQQLATLLDSHSSVAAHPWSGINNYKLNYVQEREVLDKVDDLRTCVNELINSAQNLIELTGFTFETSHKMLQILSDIRLLLPQPEGSELISLIPKLNAPSSRKMTRTFLESLVSYERTRENLLGGFSEIPLLDSQTTDNVKSVLLTLLAFNAGGVNKTGLSALLDSARTLHARLKEIPTLFNQVTESLGIVYGCTLQNLPGLTEVLALLKQTDFNILHLRHPVLENQVYDLTRKKAHSEFQVLQHRTAQLSRRYVMSRLPPAFELWVHADVVSSSSFVGRLFNAEYRAARSCYRALRTENGNSGWSVMAMELKELAEYSQQVERFSASSQYHEAFGHAFKGMETPFSELAQLQSWYSEIRARLSSYQTSSQALIDALQTLPVETLRRLVTLTQLDDSTIEFLRAVPSQLDRLGIVLDKGRNTGLQIALPDLVPKLSNLVDLLTRVIELLMPIQFLDHVVLEDMPRLLEEAALYRIAEKELDNDTDVSALLGDSYHGVKTDRAGLEATLTLIDKATHQNIPSDIQTWLLTAVDYPTRVQKLADQLHSLNNHFLQYSTLWDEFVEFVELDPQYWHDKTTQDLGNLSLNLIQARLDKAFNAPRSLSEWLDFVRSRKELEDIQLTTIVSLAEQGHLSPNQLTDTYDFSVYNGLTHLIFKAHPSLLNFSRSRHEKIREQFIKLDKELLTLYRTQAAYDISRRPVPKGNARGPIRDYTDRALIEHEMQKQRGHIPIRSLINRAHAALLGLKPCFMMGPMSVAQYLEPGMFHFDLVVMDEASQLRPEDALGAVSRGSQLVIVGDPKQLPPTSFFDMLFVEQNEAEEDDSLAIEESESILDRACEVYQPIRQLRWHYRSRHESLIAFSNHRFYDQNLILFPSAENDSSRLGVKFHFVQEGVYNNRINRLEADTIVQAVLNHMEKYPNESLGVATFNSAQRDLLEELLDVRVKVDPIAQAYIAKWATHSEPFFIKNLETVQGDERDCIFVSFTYGRDVHGNMYQRFGPINGINGHRRLNVLFTRAKLRTEVFSSMQPEDITVGDDSSLGLKAMKAYLAYAKTGVLEQPHIGEGPELNDFEKAIRNALERRGFNIQAQVGIAGYFIDLAVRHPKKQGCFILGIECDGATYHSAKSARDRDRLRQTNLENLGWRIHRIWSSDWFRNSTAEIERIELLVNNLLRCDGVV